MGLLIVFSSFWWLFQQSDGRGSVRPMELTFSSLTKRPKFFTDRFVFLQAYDSLPFLADRGSEWNMLNDFPFALDFGLYSLFWERDVHMRFLILKYYRPSERAVRLYKQITNLNWFGESCS